MFFVNEKSLRFGIEALLCDFVVNGASLRIGSQLNSASIILLSLVALQHRHLQNDVIKTYLILREINAKEGHAHFGLYFVYV